MKKDTTPVTLDEIQKLIELVQKSEIAELRVTRAANTVHIIRQAPVQYVAPPAVSTHAAPTPPPVAHPTAAAPAPAEQAEAPTPSNLHDVTAPMIGTFYRAPSPESAPYINVGDRIEEGQIICIIEAMKLMNEIPADRSGTVVEIAIDNAQPVEFGQTLIRIKPD